MQLLTWHHAVLLIVPAALAGCGGGGGGSTKTARSTAATTSATTSTASPQGPTAPAGATTFEAVSGGLPTSNVRALAVDPKFGDLYAGTDVGVFRSSDGVTWKLAGATLPTDDVRSLTVDASGTVFAGTADGVFRSEDGGGSWTARKDGLTAGPDDPDEIGSNAQAQIPAIAADPTRKDVLFCGKTRVTKTGNVILEKAKGVYASTDGGKTWRAARAGLGDVRVSSLAVTPDGTLFAATTSGLGRLAPGAGQAFSFGSFGNGGAEPEFRSVTSDATGAVLAGTATGLVFASRDGLAFGPPSTLGAGAIDALALDPKAAGSGLAGTAQAGVFATTDAGASFASSSDGLGIQKVTAIVFGRGFVYVGTETGGVFRRPTTSPGAPLAPTVGTAAPGLATGTTAPKTPTATTAPKTPVTSGAATVAIGDPNGSKPRPAGTPATPGTVPSAFPAGAASAATTAGAPAGGAPGAAPAATAAAAKKPSVLSGLLSSVASSAAKGLGGLLSSGLSKLFGGGSSAGSTAGSTAGSAAGSAAGSVLKNVTGGSGGGGIGGLFSSALKGLGGLFGG